MTLPEAEDIASVSVTNRAHHGGRLSGFFVHVDGVQCAGPVSISDGETVDVPCSATGREVEIRKKDRSFLTLCEVPRSLPYLPAFLPPWSRALLV